jgi:hypothetical protein
MTIDQLNKKLAGIETKVRSLVGQSIVRHQKEIIKRNQDQLKVGEDSTGNALKTAEHNPYGSYKDAGWIAKRRKKGKQTSFVDLNFNGDWQGSMYVKFDSVGMSFGVDATKKKMWKGKDVLVHHWGDEIYGLNDENFDWLLDEITTDLYNGLTKYFT